MIMLFATFRDQQASQVTKSKACIVHLGERHQEIKGEPSGMQTGRAGNNWPTCSRELFSDRAFRALNISTTTKTVMATVEGCLSLKMAHISSVSQCRDFMSSDHVSLGPVCAWNRSFRCLCR